MTGQTVGEHRQLFCIVGFAVTFKAVGDLAMLLMTHGTGNLAVLARRSLPFRIDTIVTATAGLRLGRRREADYQRSMDALMAGHAILYRLICVVTIVALRTVRNIAMLLMMATLAILLCVGTRELNQFFSRSGMTIRTGLAQPIHRRHL